MKWANIFTIPDTSLVGDASVDPMGMQIIWTYFGQKIFENKLTTVSNDIRNYTISLLHHYVLYRLEFEHSTTYRKAKEIYKDDYPLKMGLLIFLEDLLVYALLDEYNNGKDIYTFGLLGNAKGTDMLRNEHSNIELIVNYDKGLLVRQRQLGVSGRYKGPFINMGLFTRQYGYSPLVWKDIATELSQWEVGKQLADKLLIILTELIENNSSGKQYSTTLSQYSSNAELWNLYTQCFGQLKFQPSLKNFWLHKLGVDKGAARALYNELKPEWQEASTLFALAKRNETDEHEAEKLSKILIVEPVLSICVHAFNLIGQRHVKHLNDVIGELNTVANALNLADVRALARENERLRFLLQCIQNAEKDGWHLAKGVYEYHCAVMQDRGGGAWLEITEEGAVKHFFPINAPAPTQTVADGTYWYNQYYLSAIQSIYNGLNN